AASGSPGAASGCRRGGPSRSGEFAAFGSIAEHSVARCSDISRTRAAPSDDYAGYRKPGPEARAAQGDTSTGCSRQRKGDGGDQSGPGANDTPGSQDVRTKLAAQGIVLVFIFSALACAATDCHRAPSARVGACGSSIDIVACRSAVAAPGTIV